MVGKFLQFHLLPRLAGWRRLDYPVFEGAKEIGTITPKPAQNIDSQLPIMGTRFDQLERCPGKFFQPLGALKGQQFPK